LVRQRSRPVASAHVVVLVQLHEHVVIRVLPQLLLRGHGGHSVDALVDEAFVAARAGDASI